MFKKDTYKVQADKLSEVGLESRGGRGNEPGMPIAKLSRRMRRMFSTPNTTPV